MQTAQEFWTPFLGRLPLDPELACCCDAGEIEKYAAQAFGPIVEQVVERMPATKSVPIFA